MCNRKESAIFSYDTFTHERHKPYFKNISSVFEYYIEFFYGQILNPLSLSAKVYTLTLLATLKFVKKYAQF